MEELNLTAIIVAVVGGAATVASAFYANHKTKEVDRAEREITFQRSALRFAELVQEWGQVSDMITDLMERTNLDRFMILRAWNGERDPQWTTAVHQIREVGQRAFTYIHVELDHDYVARMHEAVSTGMVHYIVDEMPESLIRGIYMTEGVTEAVWAHLNTYSLQGSESKAIEYVSFGTRHSDGFSETDLYEIRLVVSRLKGLSVSLTMDKIA